MAWKVGLKGLTLFGRVERGPSSVGKLVDHDKFGVMLEIGSQWLVIITHYIDDLQTQRRRARAAKEHREERSSASEEREHDSQWRGRRVARHWSRATATHRQRPLLDTSSADDL